MLSTQGYKGTRDFYPIEFAKRAYIFDTWRSVCATRGFLEYESSIVEPKEIYTAKSGEELASTQLYSFTDKGDREIALRPEQTPSLARMVAAKYGELPLPLKWFCIPNCWRYERPQKGRLREFWQLNVDSIGAEGPAYDVELLSCVVAILAEFGASTELYSVRLNHREVLDQWIEQQGWKSQQGELYKLLDSWKKLTLEKKTQWLQELNINYDFDQLFDPQSAGYQSYIDLALKHPGFGLIIKTLEQLHPSIFVIDPTIVRGIAYYTGMVFEVFDSNHTNPRALCGGGRYDSLLELFGKSAKAVGFGWGDVTMHEFLESHTLYPNHLNTSPSADVAILLTSHDNLANALNIQQEMIKQDNVVYMDLDLNRSYNKRRQALQKKAKQIIEI